jgi:hypothetical protein
MRTIVHFSDMGLMENHVQAGANTTPKPTALGYKMKPTQNE